MTFDYSKLSPNIRLTVNYLHKLGFETTDSGDGSNYKNGMECAVPEPMVVIKSNKQTLISDSNFLFQNLCIDFGTKKVQENVSIETSYSPIDKVAIILVLGMDDSWFEEKKND